MQRYQTEDEHRKAMRAKINKTIKRGRRRKRIIRRLNKAVPGICIGVLIAGMGAWCIAAPLPDPDDYEPYRFQAENGQWYTQEEYEQALLRQQIEGVLGNTSFERLVAAFCGKTLSKAQIEKTRNLLKELEDELEDK